MFFFNTNNNENKYAKGGEAKNKSDEYIIHVYKKRNEEKAKALAKLDIPYKIAYGDIIFDIDDVFVESGNDNLKFKVVGYGGVRFLGNINGKVPTQGLYYKDEKTKKQVETLIRVMDIVMEETADAIKHIEENHGKPKSQHAVLAKKAESYAKGGSVQKIKKGDLVFAKHEGSRGLVGLVLTEPKKDAYGLTVVKVYFRGYNGDILESDVNDLVEIEKGSKVSFAINNGDINAYQNIAKNKNYFINPSYEKMDDDSYAKGGEVFDTHTTEEYGELMHFGKIKDGTYFKNKYSDGVKQSSWLKPLLNYYEKTKSYLHAARNKEVPNEGLIEFLKKQKMELQSYDTEISKEIVSKEYANGGGVKSFDFNDAKLKMYEWFEAWIDNRITDEELVSKIKRKLGSKWFRFFKQDTLDSDWRSIETSIKTPNNRRFIKENMEIALENKSLEIYDTKGNKYAKGGSVSKTRKDYVEYLNEIGVPEMDKEENGGRVPASYYNKYGEWLRKYDQIAFNVGYSNYTMDEFSKGGEVGMPLVITFAEFITGSEGDIDLTKSREEVSLDFAKKYASNNNKRLTDKVKDYFKTSPDIYWRVRDLIERIETDDFEQVLKVFAYLYPQAHPDWKSALHMGLIYKAKSREGNYADKPHIYNHPMAISLREKGINFSNDLVNEIVQKYANTYANGGGVTHVSIDEAFIIENGDGKTVKLADGVTYKIKARYANVIYPYKHTKADIVFEPVSKTSPKYKAIKAELGDDWLTDWKSMSDENRISVLKQLGKTTFEKGGGAGMTCVASLIDPSKNKIVKTSYITGLNYAECEEKVVKMNENLKGDKYWKITTINYAKGGYAPSLLQEKMNKHKEECLELYPNGKMALINGLYGVMFNGKLHNTLYVGERYFEIDGTVYEERKLGNPKPTNLKLKKGGGVSKYSSKELDKRFEALGWNDTTEAYYGLDYTPFMNVVEEYMDELGCSMQGLDNHFNQLDWRDTTEAYYGLDYTPFMSAIEDYCEGKYATGGEILDEDAAIVTAVKWVKNITGSGMYWNTDLVLVYDGDTRIKILSIDDEHNHLTSMWLDAGYFKNMKTGNKFNKTQVRQAVIDLIKENKIETIKRDDVKSSILKYIKMADKYEDGGEVYSLDIDEQEVFDAYVAAALWSSNDDNGDPLDSNYTLSNIAPDTLQAMRNDVKQFIEKNKDVIRESELSNSELGHSFWLTRNHHGAGFFDYALDDAIEKQLMDYSHAVKGVDLYVGDDGFIHHMSTYADGGNVSNEKYANIVFLEGSQATEALEIYDNDGVEAAINHLSQFDYGTDSEYELRDDINAGSQDKTWRKGNYILTVNTSIGYIGLERAVVENEKKKNGGEEVIIKSDEDEVEQKVYDTLSDLISDYNDLDSIDDYDDLVKHFEENGKVRVGDSVVYLYNKDGEESDSYTNLENQITNVIFGE